MLEPCSSIRPPTRTRSTSSACAACRRRPCGRIARICAICPRPSPACGPDEVDLEALREWLWRATQRGDARSTLARRTAAARGFFAWAAEDGLVVIDPSLRLVAPKRGTNASEGRHRRRRPGHARRARRARGRGRSRSTCATTRCSRCSTVRRVRVSELPGSTSTTSTSTGRPCGCSARDPRSASSRSGAGAPRGRGLPDAGAPGAGEREPARQARAPRSSSARAGPASRRAPCTTWSRGSSAACWARRPSGRTRCGTPPRRTCSTGEPICAPYRSCSGMPVSAPPRSTPTSHRSGSRRRTDSRTRAREPRPRRNQSQQGSSTARGTPPSSSIGLMYSPCRRTPKCSVPARHARRRESRDVLAATDDRARRERRSRPARASSRARRRDRW